MNPKVKEEIWNLRTFIIIVTTLKNLPVLCIYKTRSNVGRDEPAVLCCPCWCCFLPWGLSEYSGRIFNIVNFSLHCNYFCVYIPTSGAGIGLFASASPVCVNDVLDESEVAQSCPTLCDPMDCSRSGSSVHGIFQARVLEWVAISFSTGSSQPRDQTWVSCIAGRHFTVWATREALYILVVHFI